MKNCLFVSDPHGKTTRYKGLFEVIQAEKPRAVFIGGDLLPGFGSNPEFISEIAASIQKLKQELAAIFPRIFIIPVNNDPTWIQLLLRRFQQVIEFSVHVPLFPGRETYSNRPCNV
jgi:Icc-related predicted phosphoesterase